MNAFEVRMTSTRSPAFSFLRRSSGMGISFSKKTQLHCERRFCSMGFSSRSALVKFFPLSSETSTLLK